MKTSAIAMPMLVICVTGCTLWLAGCNGGPTGSNVSNNAAAAKDTGAGRRTAPDPNDTRFALAADSGSRAEIALGNLAEKNSGSLRVKNFGLMLVKDQTKTQQKLESILSSMKIVQPATQTDTALNSLKQKTGEAFDRAYISDMIIADNRDIKTFEFAVQNCSDSSLKAFARKTLPALKNHLDALNTLRGL